MENILSIQEAAVKWKVSERTVRKWCFNKTIKATQINNEWVIYNNQPSPLLESNEFCLDGLKRAVKDFNSWNGVARIYLDLKNHSVWTLRHEYELEIDLYVICDMHEVYRKGLQEDNLRAINEEELLKICYSEYLISQLDLEPDASYS